MENVNDDQTIASGHGNYKVRIDEQTCTLHNPEPTARELLALVGRDPIDFFLVSPIEGEPDQVLELDETFDLRAPGIEILVLISRDRRFNIQVDEQNFTVKGPFITGTELLHLVGKDPETHFVTQVLVGADDIVIRPDDCVDLTIPVRERFSIVVKPCDSPVWKVDIDGRILDWIKDTITTEDVIYLGNLNPYEGVIVIDADNNERTLAPGEVVQLAAGICFGRKVRFRRG